MASPIVDFLRRLPHLLATSRSARRHGRGGRSPAKPTRRISTVCSLTDRAVKRLLERLDCDQDGRSLRTGDIAWPDSIDTATAICQHIGGERLMVLVLASWLEGVAQSTRRTYAAVTVEALRDLRVAQLRALADLPEQAVLTWQRGMARRVMPRTVNKAIAAMNSLMGHLVRIGLSDAWSPIPAVKITKGRHVDRDGVVLSPDQLVRFWSTASLRPGRQFLALMLASLHGLRASDLANLTWGSIRYQRRGKGKAPAVIHVMGKGRKHRMVHVHPAVRSWLEREKSGKPKEALILADIDGTAPSPQVVSWWARDVFRRSGITGYGHALRATWATMALENRANDPLQVQQSGGWKDQGTMLGHYFNRRKVPLIKLVGEHRRY